jgi:hypothetical protein
MSPRADDHVNGPTVPTSPGNDRQPAPRVAVCMQCRRARQALPRVKRLLGQPGHGRHDASKSDDSFFSDHTCDTSLKPREACVSFCGGLPTIEKMYKIGACACYTTLKSKDRAIVRNRDGAHDWWYPVSNMKMLDLSNDSSSHNGDHDWGMEQSRRPCFESFGDANHP